MTTEGQPRTEKEYDMNPWQETARMYADNADYWRARAERAERFSLSRLVRAIRRSVRR